MRCIQTAWVGHRMGDANMSYWYVFFPQCVDDSLIIILSPPLVLDSRAENFTREAVELFDMYDTLVSWFYRVLKYSTLNLVGPSRYRASSTAPRMKASPCTHLLFGTVTLLLAPWRRNLQRVSSLVSGRPSVRPLPISPFLTDHSPLSDHFDQAKYTILR